MSGKIILLVDDDAGVAQVLASVLSEKGRYTALQAYTADEAVRINREQKLDLLLVDVRLGVSSGKELAIELLQIVRAYLCCLCPDTQSVIWLNEEY